MVTNGRRILNWSTTMPDAENSTRSAGSHTAVSASLCTPFRYISSKVRSPSLNVIFSRYSTCGVTNRYPSTALRIAGDVPASFSIRLGVDETPNRQRGDFLHGIEDHARIGRTVAAVDQHHAFLGDHDAAIGIEVIADVDVDAFFDLFNIGRQVLGVSCAGERSGEEN